ncbi:hypothetical protein HanIR_Chr06g0279181 [Helianthus annuus]|nr:hypothetical protein HanIR_Chr06g0279181 [Helianthus annuus]
MDDVISVDYYKNPIKYKAKYDFSEPSSLFSLSNFSLYQYLSSRRRVVAEGPSHLCGEPNGFLFCRNLSQPLTRSKFSFTGSGLTTAFWFFNWCHPILKLLVLHFSEFLEQRTDKWRPQVL